MYVWQSVKPTVTIRIVDPKASESGKDRGKLAVKRTGDISRPLTVYYRVAGSATNGIDYRNLSGKLTIPKYYARAELYLTLFKDRLKESRETLKVTLLKNEAYQVGSPASAVVTITDGN
jgi:hypothetical protein